MARAFPAHAAYLHAHADRFPINGQYVNAMSIGLAIVVLSSSCRWPLAASRSTWPGCSTAASGTSTPSGRPAPLPEPPPRTWRAIIGIDEHFTVGDKRISVTLFAYSTLWFAVFAVISVWNLIRIWPDHWWVNYWFYTGVVWPIVLGTVTSVWFTIGGVGKICASCSEPCGLAVADPADDGETDVPEGGPAIPTPAFATVPGEEFQPQMGHR